MLLRSVIPICLLILVGCEARKKDDFAPKYFSAHSISDDKSSNESLNQYLSSESEFLQEIRKEMEMADSFRDRGMKGFNYENLNIRDCFIESNTEDSTKGKCLSVDERSMRFLKAARRHYIKLLTVFKPVVVDEEANHLEMQRDPYLVNTAPTDHSWFIDRDGLPSDNDDYIGYSSQDVWWSETMNSGCEGYMPKNTQRLCTDLLHIEKLYDIAFESLDKYTESLITEGGSANKEHFEKFNRYHNLAAARFQEIVNLQADLQFRLVAFNSGNFRSVKADTVPYFAVVLNPEEILGHLRGIFGDYKAARIAEANTLHSLAETDEKLLHLRKEVKEIKLNTELIEKEKVNIDRQVKSLQEYLARSQRLLTGSFSQFAGSEGDRDTALKSVDTTVSAGTADLVISNLPSQWTTISVSASSGSIRANAIYKGQTMGNSFYLNKMRERVSEGFDKAMKRTTKFVQPGISAIKSTGLANLSVGGIANPLTVAGGMLGNATFGKPSFESTLNSVARNLRPLTKIMSTTLENALPKDMPESYESMLRNIGQDKDKLRPSMDYHVRGVVTNVEGYILSINRGTGASIGKSTGVSGNVGIGGGALIVNASAGLTTSKGNSAGINRSVGQSMQVGFYHRKARYPRFKVGMLMAEIICDGGVFVAPIGISNIVMKPAGENCSQVNLFINDHPDSATATCDFGKGVEKCSSGSVKVNYQIRSGMARQFNELRSILHDDKFMAVTNDAAFTTDYLGNSIRIFRAMANERGLSPEAIEKYLPIVKNYASVKHTERQITDLNLEFARLRNQTAKSENLKHVVLTSIDMYRGNESLQTENGMRAIQKNLLTMHQSISSLHGKRLDYWLQLYRSAMEYHQVSTPKNLAKLFGFRNTLVRQDASQGQQEYVLTWDSGDIVELEGLFARLSDFQFKLNGITQQTAHICYTDIKLDADSFITYGNNSVEFDTSIASQYNSEKPSTVEYSTLTIHIKPSQISLVRTGSSNSKRVRKGHYDSPLECTASGLTNAKILSIGASFHGLESSANPPPEMIASHNHVTSFIDLNHPNHQNVEVFRRITFTDDGANYGISNTLNSLSATTKVKLAKHRNLLAAGCSNDDEYDLDGCRKSLLIGNTENNEFKSVFLNRYIGGSYSFTLPTTNLEIEDLATGDDRSPNSLRIFFFVKQRDIH